jgi:3-oxoacyl-[acyl-carrier protein] reductase
MDLQLAGKVALVTGASMGLGRSIASLLAEEGCRLAIVARRVNLLEKVANEIAAMGRERPLVMAEDITADGAAERIKEQAIACFGSVDVLVNNAGSSRPLTGLGTEAEWEEAMLLNYTAGRRLAHAFVPVMRERKFGRVINITGGDEPTIINAANPPNGAAHIWAKALSRTVAKDGITVNCVVPGRLHSEQIDQRILPTEAAREAWIAQHCPVGYIGEPDDLGVLVTFLCSPRARYITGQVMHVDGGVRRFAH